MFLKRKSSHLNPQTRTRPEDSKHARGNMRAPRAPLATLRKSGEGRGPAPHATRGPGPDRRRARARARARALSTRKNLNMPKTSPIFSNTTGKRPQISTLTHDVLV